MLQEIRYNEDTHFVFFFYFYYLCPPTPQITVKHEEGGVPQKKTQRVRQFQNGLSVKFFRWTARGRTQWTEYHYSVFIFGTFLKPNIFGIQYLVHFQIPKIFGIWSKFTILPSTRTDENIINLTCCTIIKMPATRVDKFSAGLFLVNL